MLSSHITEKLQFERKSFQMQSQQYNNLGRKVYWLFCCQLLQILRHRLFNCCCIQEKTDICLLIKFTFLIAEIRSPLFWVLCGCTFFLTHVGTDYTFHFTVAVNNVTKCVPHRVLEVCFLH
jgi:hypothetical protein